jgi:tRNA-dihydrouridine synthase
MAIKRKIFYSFHYGNDVFRVQQIRNIGALEDNKPVSVNDWETVKKGGVKAIEKWIDDNMKYRSCVVVLIGEETYKRPWVKYEIKKAWQDGKGLLGIKNGNVKTIPCKTPTASDAYNSIKNNMETWIDEAIKLQE